MSIRPKQIDAIPTEYLGLTFRSRLEARWAVFFGTRGIPWEYEPARFKLAADDTYLPDFLLAGRVIVEIKPERNDEILASREKLERLSQEARCLGLLVCGSPGVGTYSIEAFDGRDDGWVEGPAWKFGRGRKEERDSYLVSDSAGACFYEYGGADKFTGEENWPLECEESDYAPSRAERFGSR